MHSKGFYSFYVFVLIVFLGLAIGQYFSLRGRDWDIQAREHVWIQMQIYGRDLASFGKKCLQNYPIQSCEKLSFDFDGYKAEFFVSSCDEKICVVDWVIENVFLLDSQPLRYTQRAVWDLSRLK